MLFEGIFTLILLFICFSLYFWYDLMTIYNEKQKILNNINEQTEDYLMR